MSELGGYKKGDEHICVTHIPERKKPVLMIGNEFVMTKMATFDSEETAEIFYDMLGRWLGVKELEHDRYINKNTDDRSAKRGLINGL